MSVTRPWVGLRKEDSLLRVWALPAVPCESQSSVEALFFTPLFIHPHLTHHFDFAPGFFLLLVETNK